MLNRYLGVPVFPYKLSYFHPAIFPLDRGCSVHTKPHSELDCVFIRPVKSRVLLAVSGGETRTSSREVCGESTWANFLPGVNGSRRMDRKVRQSSSCYCWEGEQTRELFTNQQPIDSWIKEQMPLGCSKTMANLESCFLTGLWSPQSSTWPRATMWSWTSRTSVPRSDGPRRGNPSSSPCTVSWCSSVWSCSCVFFDP